jgi:NADH:ubiquinone oxidoreductase subunit 3 (subunit A)
MRTGKAAILVLIAAAATVAGVAVAKCVAVGAASTVAKAIYKSGSSNAAKSNQSKPPRTLAGVVVVHIIRITGLVVLLLLVVNALDIVSLQSLIQAMTVGSEIITACVAVVVIVCARPAATTSQTFTSSLMLMVQGRINQPIFALLSLTIHD